MAAYQLSTTTDQDALLKWVVDNYNKDHSDTKLSVVGFLQVWVAQLLAANAQDFADYNQAQLQAKFEAASAATQAQVKTLLGVS